MAKNVYYFGRTTPLAKSGYRKPPLPTPDMRAKCNLHNYPWKYECPSCDLNTKMDADFTGLLEAIDGGDF